MEDLTSALKLVADLTISGVLLVVLNKVWGYVKEKDAAIALKDKEQAEKSDQHNTRMLDLVERSVQGQTEFTGEIRGLKQTLITNQAETQAGLNDIRKRLNEKELKSNRSKAPIVTA